MLDLNNCYIKPSKKIFKELKKLGYSPYNKHTFQNSLKNNHMLCIINDIIYHRPLEECENLQKIEFVEEQVINQNTQNQEHSFDIKQLKDALKSMALKKENDKKKYSHFEYPQQILSNIGLSLFLSNDIHKKVKNLVEKDNKPKVLSIVHNNDKFSFYKPTYHCEFSALKIDPETEDYVIIGFVIDFNQIIPKKWSLSGQDLTHASHNLNPFDIITHHNNEILLKQLSFSLTLCNPSNKKKF